MDEFDDLTFEFGLVTLPVGGVTAAEVTDAIDDALAALDLPEDIGDLGDVDTTSDAPSSGDLLQFDGTNWVPYTPEAITVPFTIPFLLDGGGDTIGTGLWYETGLLVNFAGEITGWHAQGTETTGSIDACDLVVTVQKATTGAPTTWTTISGTEKPTLSNQSTASDTSLSTWTTAFSSLDRFRVSVDSGTAEFATITLLCTREVGP